MSRDVAILSDWQGLSSDGSGRFSLDESDICLEVQEDWAGTVFER